MQAAVLARDDAPIISCSHLPGVAPFLSMSTQAFLGEFLLEDAHELLARIEQDHPSWFLVFDSICSHPLSHERGEILEAMASAPHPFLKGILYGSYIMSLQIEQVTGRS